MKNRLNIFSNNKIKNFLSLFFYQYELFFMSLEDANHNKNEAIVNIIIINNYKDIERVDFKNLNGNYLLFSKLNDNNLELNNKIKVISTPASINNIRNTIKNFIQNLKIEFHDILIHNEKLTNLNNKSFCYLTKVELEILNYLINEKEASKDFIKKNILNIKSNIKTNSLESHLSRIRKKMNKVNTNIRIETKGEKLLIKI